MEENVYLIDLLLGGATAPVVLTGAQRAASEPDADGPANLRDAIRVAAAAEARRRGALLSFAGNVHAVREVRKVHTSALDAFASPATGRSATSTATSSRFDTGPSGAAGPGSSSIPSGSRSAWT